MSQQSSVQPELLNSIGYTILKIDTRWVILGAIGVVFVFLLTLKIIKKHWASRDDAVSLALALLQLYSAPVLFSMLVLTKPPAVELVGDFQRQGAGLLAFIFLVAGVFMQIKKIWTGGSATSPPQIQDSPPPAAASARGGGSALSSPQQPAAQPPAAADGAQAPRR